MIRVRPRILSTAAVFLAVLFPASGLAQAPRAARVQVTVVDPSSAVVPDATVDLVGLEQATQAVAMPSAKTSGAGVAIIEGVAPGRYSIRASFPGFDLGLLRDVRLRTGDNRHVVVLPLQRLEDTVTVSQDTQAAAADRRRSEFGVQIADDLLQTLADDPLELARQIAELAGPDAIVRVDSFEGQSLPPKAQIKSIHVVRDQFAAETAQPGSTFVDVVTQPGIGPIRGSLSFTLRTPSATGQSRFTSTRAPEEFSNVAGNAGGSLVRGKTSFSANLNRMSTIVTPILNAALPDGTRAETLDMEQPNTQLSTNVLVDHAITRDQTLRVGFNSGLFRIENLHVRVTDAVEGKIYRVFPVGIFVSSSRPEPQLDKLSNLHLLFQTGARVFNYSVVDPDGQLILRQKYEYTATRPILKPDKEGNIIVAGGIRRPMANDLPPGTNSIRANDVKAPKS